MSSSDARKRAHIHRHTLRWLLIPVMMGLPFGLMSQELISTEFEKGYVKDGLKLSVWEYYDINRNLELKINHTTGKVYFLKEDTSTYFIEKNGEWVEEKLKIYPIPIDGYYNFHRKIKRNIQYPVSARRMGIDGTVMITFEVDTAGVPGNYLIISGISADCDREAVRVLEQTQTRWIPAQIDGVPYKSRFVAPIVFYLHNNENRVVPPPITLPPAKVLNPSQINVFGIDRPYGSTERITVRALLDHTEKYTSLDKALSAKQKVEYLSLDRRNLHQFPADIFKLEDLISLDLEGNELSELPDQIATLKKLQELYLAFNTIKALPDQVSSLKKLRILSLGSNQFTQFPQQVCSCLELEGLDLSKNGMPSVPPCISSLKKLRIVALNGNQIKALPDEFYKLKRLEVILLKNNPLDPETVKRIQSNFRNAKIILD